MKGRIGGLRAIELSLGDSDTEKLRSIAQSRMEPASRVERARISLAYREDPSLFAAGRALGASSCVERAVAEDPMAALFFQFSSGTRYGVVRPSQSISQPAQLVRNSFPLHRSY
jgi:hypothetical protein